MKTSPKSPECLSESQKPQYVADMTRVINTVSSLRERFGIGATIREVVDGLRALRRQRAAEAAAQSAEPTITEADIARLKMQFFKILSDEVRGSYVIDDRNRTLLEGIFFWALGMQERTTLNVGKGLLLQGGIGAGKTTLLRALRRFDVERNSARPTRKLGGFQLVTASAVCLTYCEEGVPGLRRYLKATAAFDEFGREQQTSTYYGSTLHVMAYVIETRYSLGLRTHIATNMMSDEEMGRAYGQYVLDRLRQLCNVVRLPMMDSRRSGTLF